MDSLDSLVGQTIGKYRIVEHLGRGGMAEVFKAYQPNLDRYVALKLMHAFLAGDQDFISRFEREAKNVAALRHPNIVQVYDFDVHNGTPYMVMEYIEGGTLKTHLENLAREGKSLTLTEAVRVVREVGKALSYAHQRNMIHRDVKPANVLLDTGGRVILTDFGIAKILTGPSYTVTGATIGTPAYMSPEQGLGRPGDHRSDIYALGVMLYQLTTGQLPFEADTPLAVMLKHVNDPLPMPRTFKPDLPEGMERIILKSMAKNPDDRFQSAQEMLDQLEDLDTATFLAIPPASMAAGAAAHAETIAKPGAEKQPAATAVHPAGATIVHPGAGATQAATPGTAAGTGPHTAAAVPAERPARRPLPLFAIVGVLLAFLLLGGGAFAFTGGFGLLRPAATATNEPTNASAAAPTNTAGSVAPTQAAATSTSNASATPDLLATQFESIQETQAAIAQALATATPSSTPDLTATFEACTFGYEVVAQSPADGASRTVGAATTKEFTLRNTGTCAFPADTVFTETVPSADLPPIQLDVPPVGPGEEVSLSFDWPGRRQPGETVRVFEFHAPDGLVIGEPLAFTLNYVAAATARPQPTNTNPPPPPTATQQQASILTDIYLAGVTNCRYVGDTGLDYECTGILGYAGGGGGPFTVSTATYSAHFEPTQTLTFPIRWRRCDAWVQDVTLFDDASLSGKTKALFFDPVANGGLFPGGACTLP